MFCPRNEQRTHGLHSIHTRSRYTAATMATKLSTVRPLMWWVRGELAALESAVTPASRNDHVISINSCHFFAGWYLGSAILVVRKYIIPKTARAQFERHLQTQTVLVKQNIRSIIGVILIISTKCKYYTNLVKLYPILALSGELFGNLLRFFQPNTP